MEDIKALWIQETGQICLLCLAQMILTGVVIICMLTLFRKLVFKKKTSLERVFLAIGIWSYACIIYSITIYSRIPGQHTGVILKHLSLSNNNQNLYVLFNVLFFVPWGFGFAIVFSKYKTIARFVGCIIISFLTSFLVEITQYITRRGYFEIDDLICNTLGGLFGCLILELLLSIRRDK